MTTNNWDLVTQFGMGGRMYRVYQCGHRIRIQEEGGKVLYQDSLPECAPKELYRHIVTKFKELEPKTN